MANPGFNIKVREVQNGFIIHVTRVGGSGGETFYDVIAQKDEIKTKLDQLTEHEVNHMRSKD